MGKRWGGQGWGWTGQDHLCPGVEVSGASICPLSARALRMRGAGFAGMQTDRRTQTDGGPKQLYPVPHRSSLAVPAVTPSSQGDY